MFDYQINLLFPRSLYVYMFITKSEISLEINFADQPFVIREMVKKM